MCFYLFSLSLHLCSLKNHFAAVFYNVACARTLYIGKTSKTLLFDVYRLFLSWYYMLVLSFVFGTFAAVYLIRFQLSRLFLNKAWCLQSFAFVPRKMSVKHYASFWIFMQSIMVNRKLLWIFEFSLAPLSKRPIFLLFVFSLFLLFGLFRRKQKQKRKIRFFAVFAVKRPFLSQIKRLFSVIYDYIGQTTPHHPVFGTSRVGQLSSENFLFFLFFIFCKILWFCQFNFSTEFWEFLRISYLLFFLYEVS